MIERAQEEALAIIKEIETNAATTQRAVSKKLGISLGKTNYLLKALINKGIIKGNRFSTQPDKLRKLGYMITPKGFEERMRLTMHFLKLKEDEYNKIKQYWETIAKKDAGNYK